MDTPEILARPAAPAPAPLPVEASGPPRSMEAATPQERRERLAGILMFIGAVVCFSGTDGSAKYLSQTLPTIEIVWARYVGSAVAVFLFVNPWTKPSLLATRRLKLQLLRSVLLFGSTTAFFMAVRALPLSQATTIGFSTPFVVVLLSGILFGQWVGPRRLAAIGVGFLGVLVVTRPVGGSLNPAVLYALASVVCNASYYLVTRMLAGTERAGTTMTYTAVAAIVVLTPILPAVWVTPSGVLPWVVMSLMGAFGALSQWLVLLAHQRAPAPVLTPFGYVQIITTSTFGFLLFGETPTHSTLVGASIVVASGLYLWYRERVVARP